MDTEDPVGVHTGTVHFPPPLSAQQAHTGQILEIKIKALKKHQSLVR